MPKHEFGILSAIDPARRYETYEPEAYACISIEDDVIWYFLRTYRDEMQQVPSYAHSMEHPMAGLNYLGITLLPLSSLPALLAVLQKASATPWGAALAPLIQKTRQALQEGRAMIHFGI